MKKKSKNAYLCAACKKADKAKDTHPGMRHAPGLCDCPCRDE